MTIQDTTPYFQDENIYANDPFISLHTHLLYSQYDESEKTTLFAPLSMDHLIGMIHFLYDEESQNTILNRIYGTTDKQAIFRYLKKTHTDYSALKIGNCLATNLDISHFQNLFAELETIQFSLNDPQIVEKINLFIKEKTQDLIQSPIKDRKDLPNRGLVAINAGSFIGKFDQPFLPQQTKKEKFTAENQQESFIDMMWGIKRVNYFECDRYQYVELGLENGRYLLKLVLPKKGTSIKNLWRLSPFIQGQNRAKKSLVEILLPKFKVSQTIELLNKLKQQQIPLLKETSCGSLVSILQKTFFELEEGGVKAAFVTSGFFHTTAIESLPRYQAEFVHTFAFELTTNDYIPILTGIFNG